MLLLINLFSCGSGSNNKEETQERKLDFSVDEIIPITVTSYFSLRRYGDTKHFYHFVKKSVVIALTFPNSSTSFSMDGNVNLFKMEESSD
jgi:hypothetical protein